MSSARLERVIADVGAKTEKVDAGVRASAHDVRSVLKDRRDK